MYVYVCLLDHEQSNDPNGVDSTQYISQGVADFLPSSSIPFSLKVGLHQRWEYVAQTFRDGQGLAFRL